MNMDSVNSVLSKYWEKLKRAKNKYYVYGALFFGFLSFRYFAKKQHAKWKKYANGPVGMPFIGSALSFLLQPYSTLNLIGSYGKMTSIQFIFKNNVFINDIALSKKVMGDKAISFSRPPIANPPYFVHFLALNGEQWKVRRGFFMKELVSKISKSDFSFNAIASTIDKVTMKNMNECINNKALWYPSKDCSFINMSLMIEGIFGVRVHDNPHSIDELLPLPEKWFVSVSRVLVLAACSPFNVGSFVFNMFTNHHNKLEKKAESILIEFMQKYGDFAFDMEGKALSRRVNKSSYIDFLLSQTELNVDEIMSDVVLSLIAGTNTTSKPMEYGFILLARNPDIQSKIYDELQQITDHQNNLNKANVFRAFIQETLRLSAASPIGMPHYAEKDVYIDDTYCIPKGSIVHNNSYFMHRGGENGNKIHLEYWLDDNGKFRLDNNKFIMFGYGGRSCAGRSVAMKLMYYVYAILITKYKFTDDHSTQPIKQQFAFVPVIKPKIGIKLQQRK